MKLRPWQAGLATAVCWACIFVIALLTAALCLVFGPDSVANFFERLAAPMIGRLGLRRQEYPAPFYGNGVHHRN